MLKRILPVLGVLLGVAGVFLLTPLITSVPRISQLSAYQLGGLIASLLIALLAFALAWQCVKKRS
jgi:phosphotransferase system  glucose/maltose/N-acetylglucosamine-specific IIC component